MSITKKSLSKATPAAKPATKTIKAAPASDKAVTAMRAIAARPSFN